MTNGQRAGAGVTVMALMTLVLSAQGLPALQYIFGEIKLLAELPLFDDVLIAILLGTFAPAWMPYALPASWPRHVTKRVTRLMACSIAFLAVFGLFPSLRGAQYGAFAATSSYMLWTVLATWVYRVAPDLEPPAMKQNAQELADQAKPPPELFDTKEPKL